MPLKPNYLHEREYVCTINQFTDSLSLHSENLE